MPDLILLNRAPASGKSTVASLLAARSMADTHLVGRPGPGHDVIVPQFLVDQLGGGEALGEMYDNYRSLLEARPSARRVHVIRGDVDATLRAVEAVIVAP